MSYFKNLEQSLREDETTRQSKQEEQIRRMQEARAKLLPSLRLAYEVVGDYYKTILEPRGYKLFPRKKEEPTPNELRHLNSTPVIYAYVANILSPVNERPYSNDTDTFLTWARPEIGEMDYHIWHPNVALQFAAIIKPIWLAEEKRLSDELELSLSARAWGRVDIDKESLAASGIRIYSDDGGWDHIATFVFITPNETKISEQVKAGLRILTPNIIHHKESFYKQ